jgi:hypothetical protein
MLIACWLVVVMDAMFNGEEAEELTEDNVGTIY